MTQSDVEYYAARAAEEDRRARSARLPEIAAVHLDFAAAYRERAETILRRDNVV